MPEEMDERTNELIAIGAHRQPCLTYHVAKAKELGIGEDEIREAIAVGHREMFCLAGIAGQVPGIVTDMKKAEKVLVIDGCAEPHNRGTNRRG